MHFVITAGPTIEPLDQVRRLTNFSTGRLGTELASHMAQRGHRVTLLLSQQSAHRPPPSGVEVVPFTTTTSLQEELVNASKLKTDAVFHAAAVCDFTFGEIHRRNERGELVPVRGGKISTRGGRLLAELVPTPKLIVGLRDLYPDSCLVGWKYEVEGDRSTVFAAAEAQIRECRTSACVVNGPAYGKGFGLVFEGGPHMHVPDAQALFDKLLQKISG